MENRQGWCQMSSDTWNIPWGKGATLENKANKNKLRDRFSWPHEDFLRTLPLAFLFAYSPL